MKHMKNEKSHVVKKLIRSLLWRRIVRRERIPFPSAAKPGLNENDDDECEGAPTATELAVDDKRSVTVRLRDDANQFLDVIKVWWLFRGGRLQ